MTEGEIRERHRVFFSVKGMLIPKEYSAKDIEDMYYSYMKRTWGNQEIHVNAQEDFDKLWEANKKDYIK